MKQNTAVGMVRKAVLQEMKARRVTIQNISAATGIPHNALGQWIRGTQGIGLERAEKVLQSLCLQIATKGGK